MLAAARRHKRVVQVGTQRRSTPHLVEARDKVIKAGLLGTIGHAGAFSFNYYKNITSGEGGRNPLPGAASFEPNPLMPSEILRSAPWESPLQRAAPECRHRRDKASCGRASPALRVAAPIADCHPRGRYRRWRSRRSQPAGRGCRAGSAAGGWSGRRGDRAACQKHLKTLNGPASPRQSCSLKAAHREEARWTGRRKASRSLCISRQVW